ncbi:MAG: HAMP domain-containing sensor histidine kinase [Ferruginibacter sp.]
MKLITRYNQYLFPLLIFLFVASTVSSYFLIKETLQNELDEILLRSKSRIEKYVRSNQSLPLISSFDDQKIAFTKIATPIKEFILSTGTQFIDEQNKEHISRELVFSINVKNETYQVTISEPLEGTKHLTRLIVKITLVTILVILLLLIIINRQVLSNIWKPFYSSLSVIKSFKVNTDARLNFPSSNINEFNLMNNHFKLAAENASRDFRNLKEFSENASHEIQTPLAIIHSKLDLLMQQESLTEKQSELMQTLYSSVNKLSKIQHSLLLLTKIDNRQFTGNNEIALDAELNNKIEQFHELWQRRSIQYTAEIEKTTIRFNKELLEILINNLFSNATRHNIQNGHINIKLQRSVLEISNTGPLQSIDPERIFRRFYKGTPTSDSNGLGLSIIKEICDTSRVEIEYQFKNGLHIFRLTLSSIC